MRLSIDLINYQHCALERYIYILTIYPSDPSTRLWSHDSHQKNHLHWQRTLLSSKFIWEIKPHLKFWQNHSFLLGVVHSSRLLIGVYVRNKLSLFITPLCIQSFTHQQLYLWKTLAICCSTRITFQNYPHSEN